MEPSKYNPVANEEAVSKLWREAKERVANNTTKLKSCSLPHSFVVPIDRITGKALAEPRLFCKWRCKECGGVADGEGKQWYELGLKHGVITK